MEEKIITYVCLYFNVEVSQVKGNSKRQAIYTPRRFCMLFLQKYCKLSTKEIGQYFNRNRSTVSRSIMKLQNELKLYKETQRNFNEIDLQIKEIMAQWQEEVIPKSETFELLLNKFVFSPHKKNLWRIQFYKGTVIEELK